MTSPAVTRNVYRATIATLTIGICVLAAFLILVAAPDLGGLTAWQAPTPSPTATPVPTPPSAMALSPIGVEMPKDANCQACHITASGTVGSKPIPRLAHPLAGFKDCTACHTTNGLVQTAPGHSSLHKDDCLICHQPPDPASPTASLAPPRPEHMGSGTASCTSCHGLDEHAPLPDKMKGRDNCWICHNGPEFQPLFELASPGSAPGSAAASPQAASASPGATPSLPDPTATPAGAAVGVTWALVAP